GGGRKEITCDRFWSEMAAGAMSAIDAAGDQAPVHAVIDGPPKRDVVARTLRIGLTNKQVSDVHATTDVVMKELEPVQRELRTEDLMVTFDPAQHRATSAVAAGSFQYKDPRNSASAVKANYDIVGDLVVLSAEPGFDPVVTTDGQTLKAKVI